MNHKQHKASAPRETASSIEKSRLLVLHLHLALQEGRRTLLNYPIASHNTLWSTKPVRSGEKPSRPVLALPLNDEMLSSRDKSAATSASTQQPKPARSYRLTNQLKTHSGAAGFSGCIRFQTLQCSHPSQGYQKNTKSSDDGRQS